VQNLNTLDYLTMQFGKKLYVSVKDLSTITGIAQSTIYNKLSADTWDLPSYVIHNRRKFLILDVAQWIDAGKKCLGDKHEKM